MSRLSSSLARATGTTAMQTLPALPPRSAMISLANLPVDYAGGNDREPFDFYYDASSTKTFSPPITLGGRAGRLWSRCPSTKLQGGSSLNVSH